MLTKLEFCIPPERAEQHGLYLKSTELSEKNANTLFEVHFDPTHKFWEGKHVNPKHTRMAACAEMKHPGIYYAYNMENMVEDFCTKFTHDESYGMVARNGVIYTSREVTEIFADFNARGALSTGKMRPPSPGNMLNMYGVADNISQVLKYFKRLMMNTDQHFVVSYYTIRREDCSERDGWRWHKNGKYIGIQKPKNEYLYDDKHIDEVIQFHITLLKEKEQC